MGRKKERQPLSLFCVCRPPTRSKNGLLKIAPRGAIARCDSDSGAEAYNHSSCQWSEGNAIGGVSILGMGKAPFVVLRERSLGRKLKTAGKDRLRNKTLARNGASGEKNDACLTCVVHDCFILCGFLPPPPLFVGVCVSKRKGL